MDHIVYLDAKAKELENLLNGTKTMIIRGAMGRKLPYGRVHKGDILYFMENKADGLVKAKAVVSDAYHSDKLSREESLETVKKHLDVLKLDSRLKKRFAGKRYLVLISLESIQELDPFEIDRSDYGNMDDWLPVEEVESVRVRE